MVNLSYDLYFYSVIMITTTTMTANNGYITQTGEKSLFSHFDHPFDIDFSTLNFLHQDYGNCNLFIYEVKISFGMEADHLNGFNRSSLKKVLIPYQVLKLKILF